MKIKDKILSETSEEVKQRVRDTANKLVMKQETLEEAAYQARRDYQDEVGKDGMNNCIMFDAMKIQKGFKQGAKWQQERSYSEEEVLKLILTSSKLPFANDEERIDWFEQFKKK